MIKKSTMFGYPKSGNSLLHAILRAIYEESPNGYTSVLNRKQEYFLFDGYDEVDDIKYEGGFGLTSESVDSKRVDINLLNSASIIWCHDVVTKKHINDLVSEDRVGFYLQRDPKSVLLSLAHHSTRLAPFIKEYKITDPQEVVLNEKIIMDWLTRWKIHTEAIQGTKELTILKYEDLSGSNKHHTVKKICEILGVRADEKVLQTVLDKTSKEQMSIKSPQHVGGRDYKIKFSSKIEKMIDEFLN